MKARAKAASTPKAKIAEILAVILSFTQKFKSLIPNSIQIIQRIQEMQRDLGNASVGSIELAWDGIYSELRKSMKRIDTSDSSQVIASHFQQIRSCITDFQKAPPASLSEKRTSRKLATELLSIISTCESQATASPTRARASLQLLKTQIGSDFVQFFRQSQLNKFQKAKRREELTRAIDSLLVIFSADGTRSLELPSQVSDVAPLIAQLKSDEAARIAGFLDRSGSRRVKSATPPPRRSRASTPPAQRPSKIPTRPASPRDDRRRSEMGLIAQKLKGSPRKPDSGTMTSILASRKSISNHRRVGSVTQAEVTGIRKSSSVADMDSDTDMMSALSRSRIMESKTHEFLEKIVWKEDTGEAVLQECLRSIQRVERRCRRFVETFGDNEAVARFLVKSGEAKMILSEGKKDEVEALFESVERAFESVELRQMLSCESSDADIQGRIKDMKEATDEGGVQTFMRNEVRRLEKLTEAMAGFTDWGEERDQEVEKHKGLRRKLNTLRQEFAELTESRSVDKKDEAELVAEIKEKHALVRKRREERRTAMESATQLTKSWDDNEQKLLNHCHIAAQQLTKLMAARRKLVSENLSHITLRGMDYTLQQLDQQISQVIEREGRITKGLSKVAKGRQKVLDDLK